jgi:hypothetical protein
VVHHPEDGLVLLKNTGALTTCNQLYEINYVYIYLLRWSLTTYFNINFYLNIYHKDPYIVLPVSMVFVKFVFERCKEKATGLERSYQLEGQRKKASW